MQPRGQEDSPGLKAKKGPADDSDVVSVACSISGCGEDIIEELMAVRCCDAMKEAQTPSTDEAFAASGDEAFNELKAEAESASTDSVPDSGDESDGSNTRTDMQRIMKQLIVKHGVHQAQFNKNDKKRKKNTSGSNDTQQQDDGLSTGIIALRVVRKGGKKKEKEEEDSEKGASDAKKRGQGKKGSQGKQGGEGNEGRRGQEGWAGEEGGRGEAGRCGEEWREG